MTSRFVSSVKPPTRISSHALWFAFSGQKLLVYEDGGSALVPKLVDFSELGLEPIRQHYLGRLDGQHCFSVELEPDVSPPPEMSFKSLRQLFDRLDDDCFALAGRAIQIVAWDRDHQFCSRCGRRTEMMPAERAKKCPHCGLQTYPRLSPCIIVRINRGEALLLARGHNWLPGRYSVVAGFVEPGETLEEAIAREVMEEVGLRVKNIRYFGSQPWPFPNSLMIGFTAEYAGGELRLEEAEIEDAGWFKINDLPLLPPKISIARQMIDAFIESET